MSIRPILSLLLVLVSLLLSACNTGKIRSLEGELAAAQQQVASLKSINKQLEDKLNTVTEENQILKNTPDGQLQVALDQINRQKLTEALATLKTLISTYPDHPVASRARSALREVSATLANTALQEAKKVQSGQGGAAAVAALKKVAASYPGTPAAAEATRAIKTLQNSLAEELLSEARSLMNQNDLSGASEKVKRLLVQYPNSNSASRARNLSSEIALRREQAALSELGWLIESIEARWSYSDYSDMIVPKVNLSMKKIAETEGLVSDNVFVTVKFYEYKDGSPQAFGDDLETEYSTQVGVRYNFSLAGSQGYRTLLGGADGAAAQAEKLPRVEYEILVQAGGTEVTAKKGVVERRVTFQ